MKRVIFTLTIGLAACDTPPVDPPAEPSAPKVEQTAPVTATPDPAPAEAPLETALEHGYDDTWYLSGWWPGEWPSSFAVFEKDVTVQGRVKIDLGAPKSIACPLPQFAHYHPWNIDRYNADALDDQSASQIERVTVSEAVSINVDPAESPVSEQAVIDLAAGESFEIIAYAAEGYALLRHNGIEYGGFPYDLDVPSTIEPKDAPTHLWLNVLCENGERAWLRREEVLEVEGVGIGEASDFGVAHDLDHPDYPKR